VLWFFCLDSTIVVEVKLLVRVLEDTSYKKARMNTQAMNNIKGGDILYYKETTKPQTKLA
jgi:hypothetical protein